MKKTTALAAGPAAKIVDPQKHDDHARGNSVQFTKLHTVVGIVHIIGAKTHIGHRMRRKKILPCRLSRPQGPFITGRLPSPAVGNAVTKDDIFRLNRPVPLHHGLMACIPAVNGALVHLRLQRRRQLTRADSGKQGNPGNARQQ